MRIYADVHILQTLPPSNVNRDDAGSPKQAVYGGVRRSRVSSQAWKRATRTRFKDLVDEKQLGTRTRRISSLLAQVINARSSVDAEAAARIANALLAELEIKPGRKAAETAYLLFFGYPQLEKLVTQVADRIPELAALDDKALPKALDGVSVRAVLGEGHPIDVALFGRMVADIPGLNVDAAVQVAHALSTHSVEIEFDYYTAVDDENTVDETGAGMIGTVEFSSATLYRYATVGMHQLVENLGGDTDAAVEALRTFLVAFATSVPAGHRNAFAHQTPPNLVTVALRTDQPVNLVSAFEQPVRTVREGQVGESISRLADEMGAAAETWGLHPLHVASTYRGGEPTLAEKAGQHLGASMPFDQLVASVVDAARARLTDVGR